MQLKAPTRRRLAGFMLVEVLVALLVASVAVLALASAHAASLRLGRMSQHRVQAMQLAADLAERLRAHRAGVAGQEGGVSPYQLERSWAAQQGEAADPLASACDGVLAACSAAQFAQADAAQWRSLLRRTLPSGAALVRVDVLQTQAEVWVAWQDPLPGSLDEALGAAECPPGLAVDAATGVRCIYLRVLW